MQWKKMLLLVTGLLAVCSRGGDDILSVGDTAPAFTLAAGNGDTVSLENFRDKNYVLLVFYPGDGTPVCTQQLCELRDDYSELEKRGVVVFGVNPAEKKSHEAFSAKHHFPFRLLVDNGSTVAAAYRAKGKNKNIRTVYIIDKKGTIIFAQRGKPPVQEMLKAVPPPVAP